jgi:hypothetical protein
MSDERDFLETDVSGEVEEARREAGRGFLDDGHDMPQEDEE